jgi:hypothetical protein
MVTAHGEATVVAGEVPTAGITIDSTGLRAAIRMSLEQKPEPKFRLFSLKEGSLCFRVSWLSTQ